MNTDRYAPHETYMKNVVKGGDRYYRIRPKRRSFWLQQFGYAVMVLFILLAAFGSLFVIAEALR